MPDKEWLYPNLRENGYTYSVLENLHYIPHVHGGLECVYVLDGELCATIDEKNYTLKKGDICLIFPQVRHSYRTPKHSNSFCFALLHDTMPDDLRSLFVDGYALPNPIYRAGSYSPLIPEMIDHMLMPEERKANRLVHTGRLLMLLGLLFDTRAPFRRKSSPCPRKQRCWNTCTRISTTPSRSRRQRSIWGCRNSSFPAFATTKLAWASTPT